MNKYYQSIKFNITMAKSTQMWTVMEVYYKHGESSLYSFVTEYELVVFLNDKLDYYMSYYGDSYCDYDNESSSIVSIIDTVIRMGKKIIDDQRGYGIIAVHMLDFETQKIEVYE